MSEGKIRQVSRPRSRPAAEESEKGQVRVVYGIHALETHVAGRTVGSVREALRQALNISPRAVVVVDGVEVDENRVLQEGELLEFVRLAGEKGTA